MWGVLLSVTNSLKYLSVYIKIKIAFFEKCVYVSKTMTIANNDQNDADEEKEEKLKKRRKKRGKKKMARISFNVPENILKIADARSDVALFGRSAYLSRLIHENINVELINSPFLPKAGKERTRVNLTIEEEVAIEFRQFATDNQVTLIYLLCKAIVVDNLIL